MGWFVGDLAQRRRVFRRNIAEGPALCVLVHESTAGPHKNEGDPAKYELAGSRSVVV
jgi:hypothetical protein